jgi:hypothetical protein
MNSRPLEQGAAFGDHNMSKLFRIRVKDGYVSPATTMTNVHGVDMNNIIVPFAVGIGIIKGKVDWKDAVRCVASGKDPSILLVNKEAAKPREDLENAPDFDQQKAVGENKAPEIPDVPKIGELALARAENRAPVLEKLTEDELMEQAKLVGVDPNAFSTRAGVVRAVAKKMKE